MKKEIVWNLNIIWKGEICIIRRKLDNEKRNLMKLGNGGIVGKVGEVDWEGFIMWVKDRRIGKRLRSMRREKEGKGNGGI